MVLNQKSNDATELTNDKKNYQTLKKEIARLYDRDYIVLSEISDIWHEYDKKVAQCHLDMYNRIYCDKEYGTPIDDEYVVLDILEQEENEMSISIDDDLEL